MKTKHRSNNNAGNISSRGRGRPKKLLGEEVTIRK